MMGRQSGQLSMVVMDLSELIPDDHLLRRMHTPHKKCSLTADDGASSPLEWCMATAGVVHRAAMLKIIRGCPGVCAWIHPQSGWYRRCR